MKTCKECGRPVFSKGLCMYHWKSKYGKPVQVSKKRFKSTSSSSNGIIPKRKKTGEYALFMEIYEENKNRWVSWISGRPLYLPNHYLFVNQFSHLLPKGKYSKQRLNKENIWTVHHEEHTLIDHGYKEQRDKYEAKYGCSFIPYYEEVEKLKSCL